MRRVAFDLEEAILLTLLIIVIIVSPLESRAISSGVAFYSSTSFPTGTKSLEPLVAKWWNFRYNQPGSYNTHWPQCVKGDGGFVGNRSVVFLGDPAQASFNGANVNATHQECRMSASQLLYLNTYGGECSQGEQPDKSVPDLLKCAQDSNKVIKLMQVKVDGKDVSSNIARESTAQPFNLTIHSSDNSMGHPLPCCGIAMDESYYLLFKPLPVGDHT